MTAATTIQQNSILVKHDIRTYPQCMISNMSGCLVNQ